MLKDPKTVLAEPDGDLALYGGGSACDGRFGRCGWGYKDMDETMGPNEAQAPMKLLDMLSPTTREWTLKWRQKCRDNSARASRNINPGDVIRLEQPLRFTDGSGRQTFRVSVERYPGFKRNRTVFTCTQTGVACHISKIGQRNWTCM